MEIPLIQQQAQQYSIDARYASETRRKIARKEIPSLRKERRIHQQAILAMTIISAISPSHKPLYNSRVTQELRSERQSSERLHQKLKQARRLERRLRAANNRAQILTSLMRRARGGDPYAMHQADLISQPQANLYI